jgi:hypothetical protein
MKKLFFAAFIISVHMAAAQGITSVTPPGVNVAEHIPQSPTASAISRYFDVPVNMNTGQPRISIPIYTIKSGNITVPLSLSYNAGGVRVNDHSGWVGMNWNIDVGGSIQKRINGFDDFSTSNATSGGNSQLQSYVDPNYAAFGMPISNMSDVIDSSIVSNQITATQRAVFFCRVANGNIDGEADEYFYSTPEGGGKLIYNQKTAQFECDKYNGWKVEHSFTDVNTDVGQFTLQNTNGLIYTFGAGDYYQNPWFDRPNTAGSPSPSKMNFNQGWILSDIYDVVNKKKVEFNVQLAFKTTRGGFNVNRVYQQIIDLNTNPYLYKSESVEENLRKGTEVTPTEITFDGGRVLFIKDTAARLDGGTNALKEIQVRNSEEKIIKKLRFTYAYEQSSTAGCAYQYYQFGNWQAISDTMARRMYLTSVQEVNMDDNGNEVSMPPYTFSYHNPTMLPARLGLAQDQWGYYNGQNGNTTLLASVPTVYPGIPTLANRNVDSNYTRYGSLKTITYPTGGKLELFMENHTSYGIPVGGLRVRSVINTDNLTGKKLVTQYSYGTGSLRYPPQHFYTYINYQGFGGGNAPREMSISSDPIYPLTAGHGSPVLYPVVTRKLVDGADELVSKHYFSNVVQPGYGQAQGSDLTVPRPKYPALEEFMGLEDKTELYNAGVVVQKDSSLYEPLHNFARHTWNVQAAFTSPDFMTEWAIWPGNDVFSTSPPNLGAATNFYAHFKESAVKTGQQQTVYDGGIARSSAATYRYDGTTAAMVASRQANSEGDTLITLYKYPHNFLPANPLSIADLQLKYLYEGNILGKPIEITNYIKKKNAVDSVLAGASWYEYDSARIKRMYKIPVQVPLTNFTPGYLGAAALVKDGRYELEAEILTMDTWGNPLTVQEKAGTTAMVWDVQKEVLTAKVAGATAADVAYTSFEYDEKGNWAIPSPARDATAAITGKKSYALANGAISKTIDAGKTYVVSLWASTNGARINGATPTRTGATASGFTLYEWTVSGTAQVTVSGTGSVDELRLHPKGALMNTYTYQPLVGLTAMADANGNIVYNEYDALGRLKLSRDRNRNIIKQYDYQYQIPVIPNLQ